jgi:dienelactone hydrolase
VTCLHILVIVLTVIIRISGAESSPLRGRIENLPLTGQASGMEVTLQVYLPPGYDDTQERFPTMYFLHGSGGVTGIAVLARYAEQAAAEHLCRPFLIVEPHGPGTPECWWVDDAFGKSKASTLVSTDVVQAVEGRYRTQAGRDGRVIAGFSMGGFGAMAQLFLHPEQYATGVAYDGGFQIPGVTPNERIRKRLERLFGTDAGAFFAASPPGRAEQYARRPAEDRPAVDYQLMIGAFGDRIAAFQQQLEQIGVARPGRVLTTTAGHNLGQVLDQCWREHFRFLGERLASPTQPIQVQP